MVRQRVNICYLCGQTIETHENKNKDHVIIKQLVKRKQPREKGFFYGGVLPTHKVCNRKFGDLGERTEAMCQKALSLLSIYSNIQPTPHPKDSKVSLFIIDRDHFQELNSWHRKELEYFGISELQAGRDNYMNPAFFQGKPKVKPFERPVNISLSVLAKSAAAYLVKFQKIEPDTSWNIVATLMHSADGDIDPQDLAENPDDLKLLDQNLYLYGIRWDRGDWSLFYIVKDVMAIFHFTFSSVTVGESTKIFPNNQWWHFKSNKLTDLVGYAWSKAEINNN